MPRLAVPVRWVVVVIPALAFALWLMLQMYTSPAAKACVAAYRAARTAADTARVDSLVPEGGADPHSCGFIRTTARWQ